MAQVGRRLRGSAALEFALCLPAFVVVLLGIAETSSYLSQRYLVQRVAVDAARIGATTLEGPDATGERIVAAAEGQARTALAEAGYACDADSTSCAVSASWSEIDGQRWVVVDVTVLAHVQPSGLGLTPPFIGARWTMLAQQQ
jgi:Flp pilus assembly protein TadG